MELIFTLLALGFLGVIFVLPIAAFVRAGSAHAEIQRLKDEVSELRMELARLGQSEPSPTAAPQPAPPSAPSVVPIKSTPESSQPHPEAIAPPPPTVVEGPVVRPPPLPDTSPAPQPAPPPPVFEPAGLPISPAKPFQWERFIGAQLIVWLGGLILFLAVAYFVKYSFDNNLIPPEVRIALGYVLGIGLIAVGVKMQSKAYQVTAQTFCGSGVLILYGVTFAAHAIYRFPAFGSILAFVIMSLVTCAAFLISARMNAQAVAVLGLLGGFLTPPLFSTGQDNPVGLFGYILFLDIGLLALASVRPWPVLVILAGLGTCFMELGWTERFLAPGKVHVPLISQSLFLAAFLGGFEMARRRGNAATCQAGVATALACGAMLYATGLALSGSMGSHLGYVGGLALVGDIVLLVLAWKVPNWRLLQSTGAALAHLFMACWMARHLEASRLYHALGSIFLVATLHSIYPVILARFRPGAVAPSWVHLFPPAGLLLIMTPMMQLPVIPIWVWPVILLLNLAAFGLAAVTRSLSAVAGCLVLTGVLGAGWVFKMPVTHASGMEFLVIVGGIAVFFLFASLLMMRLFTKARDEAPPPAWLSDLPAASALMPFMLLILATLQLRLANPSPVFALGLALANLLLSAARSFARPLLALVGLVSVVALQFAWRMSGSVDLLQGWIPLAWHLAFATLLFVFPFLSRSAFANSIPAWVAAALSFPLHFRLIYAEVQTSWPNPYMGLLPALLSLPLLAGLAQLNRWFDPGHPLRNTILAWHGGAALFFISLIFPIQWERQWITVSWALEGAALCWLFHRIPHPGLRIVGVG
ncbi:MAG: DUF2339 domain-containing protein, partial [Verrucomicrobia bacterium]|nr:DUF2339 domain-containing protein [Verrucomicrobiota bacterium]